MEPGSSSPHSKQLATRPYPEPDRPSPSISIQLLEDSFQYYLHIEIQIDTRVKFQLYDFTENLIVTKDFSQTSK